MKWLCTISALVALSLFARADDKPKPAALTPQEIADGWIMLFDGETTYGWKIEGEAAVKNGVLLVGGPKPTTATSMAEFVALDYKFSCPFVKTGDRLPTLQLTLSAQSVLTGAVEAAGYHEGDPDGRQRGPIVLTCPANCQLQLRYFKIKPRKLEPLFNGKDLAGWKPYTGDPKREKSKFTVTPEGWLNLRNGPGDLQTEKQFADFVLQVECISNGKNLNSGIFFRALPGQYQQGYERRFTTVSGTMTAPSRWTMAPGRFIAGSPARKVVSNDHEWFTMTVVAHGNHIATWVNGYQTVDFTDTRPANDNARNGSKTAAGAISLQGHDATTDLSFRNIRIAELPK